jgi:peptide chain release factor 1
MAEKTLLEKLEGLQHKFEEISTLITDPAVIGDMKRYVKLNKEYRELERIMQAQQEYKTALTHLAEAKEILDGENDPEMREMAKMEVDEIEPKIPEMEENIKLLLIIKMPLSKFAVEPVATKLPFLPATFSACTQNTAKQRVGKWK